jgi:RNA polymerase sigma factor (sigma-70 family)
MDARQHIPEHDSEALGLAFARLSTEDQLILWMRFIAGLGNVEIAAILIVSPNAVGVRVHRACKRLRTFLENCDT